MWHPYTINFHPHKGTQMYRVYTNNYQKYTHSNACVDTETLRVCTCVYVFIKWQTHRNMSTANIHIQTRTYGYVSARLMVTARPYLRPRAWHMENAIKTKRVVSHTNNINISSNLYIIWDVCVYFVFSSSRTMCSDTLHSIYWHMCHESIFFTFLRSPISDSSSSRSSNKQCWPLVRKERQSYNKYCVSQQTNAMPCNKTFMLGERLRACTLSKKKNWRVSLCV